MEPSSSAANANSGNPMADGIFQNLRAQLDQIQATTNAQPASVQNVAATNSRIEVGGPPADTNLGWRERAMINHQRDAARPGNNRRIANNPRLYGHVRSNRTAQNQHNAQMTDLRALRRNMENFDSMLEEIERFQ